MLHRVGSLLGLVALTSLAGCDDGNESDGSQSYQLIQIKSYGALEQSGTEGAMGGPVLADIADIAADADGRIYVLDRGWKKLVLYGPDASFDRVVIGGEGEGLGEFRLPSDLDFIGTGSFSVLDYELSRVTRFKDWKMVGVYRLDEGGGFLRHIVHRDTVLRRAIDRTPQE